MLIPTVDNDCIYLKHLLLFHIDLDLMAGITKDEGSVFLTLPGFLSPNITKADFDKFANLLANPMFHNIDVEKVTEFYLNNTNMNDLNAIKWRISDFFGDLAIKCPVYLFAKRYAELSSDKTNVFLYELTHNPDNEGLKRGVRHGADVAFIFGLLLLKPNTTSEEDLRFSEEVVKLWTDFAKYGSELTVKLKRIFIKFFI